jgi:hypothetical protein
MSDSPQSPENLDDVDREIRIERMKQELNEISDGTMIYESPSPLPLEMEEEFLEHVLAFERAEFDTDFNRLVRSGVSLPPLAELDDRSLSSKITEIILELAEMRCFVTNTDHLSDGQFYEWLWRHGLREETPDTSGMPAGAWHTSPIGAGSEEDTMIWLTYYADEEDRQRWHNDFPNHAIPDHQPLPFDRDRFLPKSQTS